MPPIELASPRWPRRSSSSRASGRAAANCSNGLGCALPRDVLFFFPRDYQDLTDRREIAELEEGKLQTVRGIVEEVDLRSTSSGRCVLGVLVRSGGGHLAGVWFNQPFMRDRFAFGQRVMLSGKPKRNGLVWEMHHPEGRDARPRTRRSRPGRILPVYPLTEGLQQWHTAADRPRRVGLLRRAARRGLSGRVPRRPRPLAALPRPCREVHFPHDHESLDRARRRFIYQELFILQLALALKRRQQQDPAAGPAAGGHGQDRRPHPAAVPLRADRRASSRRSAEIAADMARPMPMNRLLQGDVGSGKTVVAVYAMLLGRGPRPPGRADGPDRSARPAARPDARQAAGRTARSAGPSWSAAWRRRNAASCSAGSPPARSTWSSAPRRSSRRTSQFARLGLVVIDEQHKFGVRQRATLQYGRGRPALPGDDRHAHPAHGDDDAVRRPGRLDAPRQPAGPAEGAHLPGRRRPAGPSGGSSSARSSARGGRATSSRRWSKSRTRSAAASLDETYEALANGQLEAFRLGLIHGRMTPDEKDAVMDDFRRARSRCWSARRSSRWASTCPTPR